MSKSPFHTEICDLLNIHHPILQGAMQGGGGVDLVAAVSEAGGLGILPTFGGTTEVLAQDIKAVRAKTDKPIAVNITAMGEGFTESRIDVCLEHGVDIITTGRADPGEKAVQRMKREGITVVSVIPTVEHAKRMVDEGVDAIVASGSEAGGHVGNVSTLPLVPAVVDAVDVPVLAAGGIGDARGFLAAFALGAVGVQIGTAFMATTESNLNPWGKEQLLSMAETDTLVTKSMTGAPVRCIATPEIRAYEAALKNRAEKKELTELAKAVRASRNSGEEVKQQSAAGQIAVLLRDIKPAATMIEEIIGGAEELSQSLARFQKTD